MLDLCSTLNEKQVVHIRLHLIINFEENLKDLNYTTRRIRKMRFLAKTILRSKKYVWFNLIKLSSCTTTVYGLVDN